MQVVGLLSERLNLVIELPLFLHQSNRSSVNVGDAELKGLLGESFIVLLNLLAFTLEQSLHLFILLFQLGHGVC